MVMSTLERIWAFVAVIILFGTVAFISWADSAHGATCLTRPNLRDQSGYWRYRIDRAHGRRCWYADARGRHYVRFKGSRETKREPTISILKTVIDPLPPT